MKAVVQRVSSASIEIEGNPSGEMGPGLVVLAGFQEDDREEDLDWVASKIVRLRIFPDDDGKMNRSVLDLGGDILVVSQFTLFARVGKGTRPSYNLAAPPEIARPLYETFVTKIAANGVRPPLTGEFAAAMRVGLCNEGPVTIIIDSRNR